MKKNVIIAGLILLIIAVLCFIFYPKSEKKELFSFPEQSTSLEGTRKVLEASEDDSASAIQKASFPFSSSLKAAFDIVRVEEDGSMIAAGKGEKGAVVSLMDGESVLTEFTVNQEGEWVYIPVEPLAVGEHEIWLRDASMNSREESEVVVVNVPEPKNAGEALAIMMSADAQEVNVLQAPVPQVQIDIDIRSVNYVNNSFVVHGNVRGTGRINVYADNLFLGNVQAVGSEWSLKVPRRLEPGRKYLIRADKVDAQGKVTARVEVPFEMEKGLEKAKRRRIRVVKGDCLWTIAKELYGSGFAYVTIYQANKNQIKDPNLIYPNQVFVLPTKPEK